MFSCFPYNYGKLRQCSRIDLYIIFILGYSSYSPVVHNYGNVGFKISISCYLHELTCHVPLWARGIWLI